LAIGGEAVQSVASGSWQRVPEPDLDLTHLTCVTQQFCMATGTSGPKNEDGSAAIWNGGSWCTLRLAQPSSDLTCPSTQFCAGAPVQQGTQIVWETWQPGLGWRQRTFPSPADFGKPVAISCTSATACWAVGRQTGPNGLEYDTASRWDGSGWTTQKLGSTYVYRIDCTASDSCMVAANSGSEMWDGSTWTAVPYDGGRDLFYARLSCAASDDCTALGDLTAHKVVTEHWDGHAWTQEAFPLTGADAALSCTADGCVTAGSVVRAEGVYVPAIAQNS
jgi:hypothetical protein